MIYFLLGMQILSFLTIIFFAIFFGLVYYWHEAKVTYLVVPLFYTLKFFLFGFLIVIVLSLLLEYAPQLF